MRKMESNLKENYQYKVIKNLVYYVLIIDVALNQKNEMCPHCRYSHNTLRIMFIRN